MWKVNSQLYAPGKESVCPLNRELGWLQSQSGSSGEDIFMLHPLGFEHVA